MYFSPSFSLVVLANSGNFFHLLCSISFVVGHQIWLLWSRWTSLWYPILVSRSEWTMTLAIAFDSICRLFSFSLFSLLIVFSSIAANPRIFFTRRRLRLGRFSSLFMINGLTVYQSWFSSLFPPYAHDDLPFWRITRQCEKTHSRWFAFLSPSDRTKQQEFGGHLQFNQQYKSFLDTLNWFLFSSTFCQ